ncbi:hypothetical protein SHAQ108633_15440 [Shewanella aquimarina]
MPMLVELASDELVTSDNHNNNDSKEQTHGSSEI